MFLAGAKQPDPAQKRAELAELKSRLDELRTQLGKSEESRGEAAEELKDTEEAISRANRSLRELTHDKATITAELGAFQQQAEALQTGIAEQQAQLGRLLHRHYVVGETDQLRHLLGGDDPNQIARDLHYLRALSRGQVEMIDGLRRSLDQKRTLARRAEAKRNELVAIEQKQQDERAELVAQQLTHRKLLARLADRIKGQRRQIDTLKRNEQRLSRLIEGLGRIIARPEPPPEKRPSGPRNEAVPEASSVKHAFATLKGKLRLPVRGELITRFGARRTEGSGASKGLFIRADEGGEVKAVAPGQIVFAEWLRGFGNLIIVDHGQGYLTVYGNNQALFKSIGQTVDSGDTIAAIGASGGSPESGLYFELRFQGQAIDPMKWVSGN